MKPFPREADLKAVRHIGIESELLVTTGNYQRVTQAVQNKINKRGMLQSVGMDGGGREFRTQPISIKSLHQVRGAQYLKEYFDMLKSMTNVIESGGTHLHISVLDSDHPNMEANAVALGVSFFEQFQKISGRNTHWADDFSRHFGTERNIESITDYISRSKSGGRRAFYCKGSMIGPTTHQTLEFRGPKGSNDADEILAWAQFVENVAKVANRESVHGVEFRELLEGERISAYVDKLPRDRKIRVKDLRKKLDTAHL